MITASVWALNSPVPTRFIPATLKVYCVLGSRLVTASNTVWIGWEKIRTFAQLLY